MGEERREILRMISEGKITPEEGERLLDALNKGEERARKSSPDSGEAYESRGSFEDMMEQFGEELEKRVEHWAEGLGREMEDFFDGPHSPFQRDSGQKEQSRWHGPDWVPEDELPGWGYDPSSPGREMTVTEGRIDFTGIRGLIIQSRMGGNSDISLKSSVDGFCLLEEDSLHDAVRRGEWAVLNMSGDSKLEVPASVEKIGLVLNKGDVRADGIDGELWIKLSLGDVIISGLKRTLWAATFKGDFSVALDKRFEGAASLNSLKGDVECRVPLGLNLDFTGRSIKGEQIAEGPGIEIKGRYRKPGNIFVTGIAGAGGENSLNLETTKGDLRILGVEE